MLQNNHSDGLGGGIAGPAFDACLFCKDLLQGVSAALLGIIGAIHMSLQDGLPTELPVNWDIGLIENLSAGNGMAGLQIIAAASLFFATRRGVARTLGVLVILFYLIMHNYGYGSGEIKAQLASIIHSLADLLEPMMLKNE